MIVVLCGGVGGSRFVRALASVVGQERITAIINTADDDVFHGLYVSPDPDIVTYALAGEVDEDRGWGFRDEAFRGLEHLRRFRRETWFQIGDRDLATHIHRTRRLREGAILSTVIAEIARAFGVTASLLPMSDDPVRTIVETTVSELSFQRYLVERHAQDAIHGVRFDSASVARPAPGVLEAIAAAEAIFIAPSNPIASIGPILAVPGIREAVAAARNPKVAVSPIIGGRSLQPPAAEMMTGLGYSVDVAAVAHIYNGLIDTLLVDDQDAASTAAVESIGPRCVVTPTLMHNPASSRALAVAALSAAGIRA